MIINLFPTDLFVGYIDTSKIVFEKEKEVEIINHWASETPSTFDGDVSNKNILKKESIEYLLKIIADLLHERFHRFELKLQNVWTNHYKEKDYQEPHVHGGSNYSFIIYKNVKKSRTYFVRDNHDLVQNFNMDKSYPIRYELECVNNQIAVFPSFLRHGVKSASNEETIAGNIEFKIK
tara:strand:+ start:870 stop:1403 length:534 start_codon:yes stop_codon:yes gene_type:complete